MRSTVLLLFLLLAQQLIAQSDLSNYHWQHFHVLPDVEAVTETSAAIWWATTDYLVRYEKASGAIEIGIDPFLTQESLRGAQLWPDQDDQLHVLNGSKMAVLQNGEWIIHQFDPFNGVFAAEEILYRTANNSYLFRGTHSPFIAWQPGENPNTVPGLGAAAPWPVHEATWDAERGRVWVTTYPSSGELGFIKDATFTAVEVPSAIDRIYELRTAPDGGIWVLGSNYLLKYSDEGWLEYPLAGNWNHWELQLSFHQDGRAWVITPVAKLILKASENTFEATDLSAALPFLDFDTPSLLVDEEIWFIDTRQKAVAHWREGADLHRQRPSAWLPVEEVLLNMSQDREGRIWITDGISAYFFSGRQWWPAETLYPNFPDSARQVVFTQACEPIVLTASDPFGFNADTKIRWYRGGNWLSLSPPIPFASSGFNTTHLFLDNNENLWSINSFSGGISVWSEGTWQTLGTNDLFPTPTFVRAVAVDEQNRQYIAADNALFVRSGQSYQHVPYDRFGTNPTNNNLYRSIRFSPQGNLWIAHDREVLKVSKDLSGEKIPFFSSNQEPLPNNSIFDIYPFGDDEVWILYANDATAFYDGLEWTHFSMANSDLQSNMIRRVEKDQQGRYWLSAQTGISILVPPDLPTTLNQAPSRSASISATPNPACCQIQISWQQEERARVRLQLVDSQGRQLRRLMDQILLPGTVDIMIDRNNLPAGTYFVQRITDEQIDSQTIIWK